jgi:ribosomal protein S18 acetylase RimI-like enzyme
MAAAGLIAARSALDGLRVFQPQRDLAAVADLIETCFAATLDTAGRSVIQEMRALSRAGLLLHVLARLNRALPIMRGFVWFEQDRLVGNVSLAPAGFQNVWIIANVAVLPEYRRRGIARQMMQAALEWVDRHHAPAILQVDADNDGARALYESLGFHVQRAFIRWRRASHLRPPDRDPSPLNVRRLARRDTNSLYDLAMRARPNDQGGMGWLRPTRRALFRPARLETLRFLIGGQSTDFWIVPGEKGEIAAALRLENRMGILTTMFDLLVHPDHQGQLEAPIMNLALCEWVGRRDPLITDHPADDEAARRVFEQNGFRAERELTHMLRPARKDK